MSQSFGSNRDLLPQDRSKELEEQEMVAKISEAIARNAEAQARNAEARARIAEASVKERRALQELNELGKLVS
ncbi:hypothetical protein [Bradyrhizobium sp. USDA 3650]